MAGGSPASKHWQIPSRLLQLRVRGEKGDLLSLRIIVLITYFQMLFISGGYDFDSGSQLDSTEVFDPFLGSWATSRAKLPQPMSGVRAANINDHVLVFGNEI